MLPKVALGNVFNMANSYKAKPVDDVQRAVRPHLPRHQLVICGGQQRSRLQMDFSSVSQCLHRRHDVREHLLAGLHAANLRPGRQQPDRDRDLRRHDRRSEGFEQLQSVAAGK